MGWTAGEQGDNPGGAWELECCGAVVGRAAGRPVGWTAGLPVGWPLMMRLPYFYWVNRHVTFDGLPVSQSAGPPVGWLLLATCYLLLATCYLIPKQRVSCDDTHTK